MSAPVGGHGTGRAVGEGESWRGAALEGGLVEGSAGAAGAVSVRLREDAPLANTGSRVTEDGLMEAGAGCKAGVTPSPSSRPCVSIAVGCGAAAAWLGACEMS